jgi:flagellar biogenesis protein FliO
LSLTSLRPAALLIAAAALIVLAAAAGGDLAGRALGAMAVVALLGLGAVTLRRAHSASGQSVLSVLERHPIAKDAGVAVLVTQGRRLVVGYGPAGVALLAELGSNEERVP